MELSDDELSLIRYWRNNCHCLGADMCPLHLKCLGDEGVNFCKQLTVKIIEEYEKLVKEKGGE